jgi:ATP-dependent Clp protease ATP-binding subunit ClpA
MGARPLGRVIQEHIKKPLADEVLFGKLRKGGTVRVTVEKKETGEAGLKLETIADEVRVKPKKEEPKKDPAPRAAAKKTQPKKAAAAKSKPAPTGKEGPKRSLVPQLPRKG